MEQATTFEEWTEAAQQLDRYNMLEIYNNDLFTCNNDLFTFYLD